MWQGAKLEWLDNPPRERGRQSLLDPIQNDWSEWSTAIRPVALF
jgi:hypothetical protein